MSKQFHGDDIWSHEVNGTINIGFMQSFIDRILGECYHITQSSLELVTKNKAMLTIETNEGLKVIRSPVTGTVVYFNNTARDFPDRLTEETVVITIRPKQVVVPRVDAKVSITKNKVHKHQGPFQFQININPPPRLFDNDDFEV